jgi:hypothetical protein
MNIENLDIKKRFYKSLNERQKRHFLALEAKSLDYGGITLLSKEFEVSRTTIHQGLKELDSDKELALESIRAKGGGRKKNFLLR